MKIYVSCNIICAFPSQFIDTLRHTNGSYFMQYISYNLFRPFVPSLGRKPGAKNLAPLKNCQSGTESKQKVTFFKLDFRNSWNLRCRKCTWRGIFRNIEVRVERGFNSYEFSWDNLSTPSEYANWKIIFTTDTTKLQLYFCLCLLSSSSSFIVTMAIPFRDHKIYEHFQY